MKKKEWTAALRRKQYAIAGALVVIAAIGTTVYYSSTQEKEREQLESELAEEMNQETAQTEEVAAGDMDTEQEAAEASGLIPPKKIEESVVAENTEVAGVEEKIKPEETDVTEEAENAANAEKTPVQQTAASQTKTLHFAPENGILWPMEGNVIINYSMDSTVYFPTLDQYKYNPAVIIEGDVNDKVYSVAKGKVTSIENDEVTGCTMTVDLGDGYQAIYGQLKELNFEVGDYVESGHVLGYISEPTKYFSVEGSNLYFELDKDGTPVNPVEFFE